MYTINCPEGMERGGGDDVRTCTGDVHSIMAMGVWNGTAPTCIGTHFILNWQMPNKTYISTVKAQ